MMTTEFRPLTMAVLYADYVISDDKIDGAMEFEDFDFINDSYICKFGPSTIDAYFRLSNGKYLNLFYSAYTNTIKVYGITKTYKNSDDKTYYAVDGVEILGDFVKVAKAITN